MRGKPFDRPTVAWNPEDPPEMREYVARFTCPHCGARIEYGAPVPVPDGAIVSAEWVGRCACGEEIRAEAELEALPRAVRPGGER
jgi:hypothetical protein